MWFVNFFNRGVWSVIGLNTVTLVSGAANLWVGIGAARGFYITGLLAALGHYVFVPLVGPSVERLFRLCAAGEKGEDIGGEGKNALDSVREWVSAHKIRMGTVDLVALAAFFAGFIQC